MVTLSVDVLPVVPLPMVRVQVDADPVESWRVTGVSGGASWLAGEGVGAAVFSDPWAPLGVSVTYTVTTASEAVEAGPLLRSHGGQHVLTDLSGRVVADFLWEKSGGDPWEQVPRHSFLDVPGRPLAPFTAAPVAGAGGGSLTARTVAPYTAAMSQLVAKNRPVILMHNETRCQMPECDVPPVRTVLLTAAPADLTARMDRAERSWALAYRLVPRPYAYLAPVATWADVAARFPTWDDVAATGMSNADLARGDWLVGP